MDQPRRCVAVVALVAALAAARLGGAAAARSPAGIATATQRATYEVLHTAGLAAEPLRAGLTDSAAAKAVRHLRTLVGAAGLAVDRRRHAARLRRARRRTTGDQFAVGGAGGPSTAGRSTVLGERDLPCDLVDCPVRGAVVAPARRTAGRRARWSRWPTGRPRPAWCRPPLETARWVGTQLALAELDTSRARLARAEVRALRAQISPHFIYNALTAIASFVRTDPERARELILEFAEFTRYSFRAHGEFTTLAEELRSIDRYLTIERARFGDRLQVRLQIAPEVLPVTPAVPVPAAAGGERRPARVVPQARVGTVSIVARDAGAECHITVEDDGVGMDPAVLLAERPAGRPTDDRASTSGCPTSTSGCARSSATSSAWSSRPRPAPARR